MPPSETPASESSAPRPLEVEQLPTRDYFRQIMHGIGISSGLALLWVMETFRDLFFRLLDRLHIPARKHRHGVAFPPGPQRPR
jgi:hypothetical protein